MILQTLWLRKKEDRAALNLWSHLICLPPLNLTLSTDINKMIRTVLKEKFINLIFRENCLYRNDLFLIEYFRIVRKIPNIYAKNFATQIYIKSSEIEKFTLGFVGKNPNIKYLLIIKFWDIMIKLAINLSSVLRQDNNIINTILKNESIVRIEPKIF